LTRQLAVGGIGNALVWSGELANTMTNTPPLVYGTPRFADITRYDPVASSQK
jgi:hypothetical protein